MAVVVQRQLAPDLCFVLHTRHPGEPAMRMLCAPAVPRMPGCGAVGGSGSDALLGSSPALPVASPTAAVLTPRVPSPTPQ